MKNDAAPSLTNISDNGSNIITIKSNSNTGSILVGVGNTTSPAVPSREQLYNCLDGNNSPLYICKRFILSAASSDILLSVNGITNQVYAATINSYVYRLLGYGPPMSKTIIAKGTAIKIPDFITVAPGSCSSNV